MNALDNRFAQLATALADAGTTLSTMRVALALFVLAPLFSCTAPAFAQQAELRAIQRTVNEAVGYRVTDAGTLVGRELTGGDYYLPAQWNANMWMQHFRSPEVSTTTPVEGDARAIGPTGSAVGFVMYKGARRACRWERIGYWATLLSPIVADDTVASEANDIAWTTGTIVGKTQKWGGVDRAFYWNSSVVGMVDLGSIGGAAGTSEAFAVSGDGLVVAGSSTATVVGPRRAFRWTSAGGMQNLGTLGDVEGESVARDISTDGLIVVGESTAANGRTHGFVYTAANGMVELSPIDDYPGDCFAQSVSDDGRIVAGTSASARFPFGEACVWVDGVAHSFERWIKDVYRVDVQGKTFTRLCVSPNGRMFSGQIIYTYGPNIFLLLAHPDKQYPIVESDDVVEGGVYAIRAGETFEATVTGADPDGGPLQLAAKSGPTGMTVTPDIGTNGPSPYSTTVRWTAPLTAFDQTSTISLTFVDELYGHSKLSFTVKVASNARPTVAPIEPKTVECVDGHHTVRLATVVDDEEGFQRLRVTWLVNNVEKKVTNDVAPGSEVDFEYDYPHGRHRVEVRVLDTRNTTIIATSVTVQDSTSPVVVAEDVVVPTDPGQDFASNVTLPEPSATDASGEGVTLTKGEAPETFPVGVTLVQWTATDAAGNVTTAAQKVTVEDREPPVVADGETFQVYVDPGQIYSTAPPPNPAVWDNVTESSAIRVTSDAPPRFPIGATEVTFRATDAAGNVAEGSATVTVVNQSPLADAGPNAKATATKEQGVRVALDGGASSDPDEQPLTYLWSAPGMNLAGKRSAKPSGLFPVGQTIVTLTVTDSAGASQTDTVRVRVRLKNGQERPRGRDANRSFAAASQHAASAVAGTASGASAAQAFAYSSAASGWGEAAGDVVLRGAGASEADAILVYAELRALQRAYGQAAADALVAAFVETGDENLLFAYGHAAWGTAYAAADLSER